MDCGRPPFPTDAACTLLLCCWRALAGWLAGGGAAAALKRELQQPRATGRQFLSLLSAGIRGLARVLLPLLVVSLLSYLITVERETPRARCTNNCLVCNASH